MYWLSTSVIGCSTVSLVRRRVFAFRNLKNCLKKSIESQPRIDAVEIQAQLFLVGLVGGSKDRCSFAILKEMTC